MSAARAMPELYGLAVLVGAGPSEPARAGPRRSALMIIMGTRLVTSLAGISYVFWAVCGLCFRAVPDSEPLGRVPA